MIRFYILLCFLFLTTFAFAQPSNDDCNGAQNIAPNGSCSNGTTVGAVDNWQQVVGCQNGNNNSSHPDVWYTFTSTGSQGQINVTTSAPWGGDVEIVLVQGNCATGFSIVGSQCGPSPLNAAFNGLQNGITYYYTISNANNGTTGPFQTCLTTTTPPTLAGQDCSNAAILCTSSQFSQSTSNAGFGNQEVTTGNSCWIFGGERQSKWFKFTVGCTGTLQFNINPVNSNDDYDWALWNITSDPNNCTTKGNSIACNWSACNDATGLSSCISSEPGAQNSNGPPCFGGYGAWGAPITVTAGNTYALLVDNFTTSNSGFVLTFGGACNAGTAKIGPDASFNYTSPSCGTYNFTKTCQTPNSSFLWQFGDGSTSTSQNPSYTYASSGTYVITLQVTDALGCMTTTSQTITVATPPAPSASSPQTFCSSANPTVASLTATGTALQWYSASSGGSPLASTTALTTQTYYVSQTVGGCESTRTPVSVTVSTATAPSASSPQTFCSSANPTVASLTATGTGLQWYSASSGGSPLASTTALTTQTYYVSQTVGGCESTRTPVSVTVSTATAPSASSPQTFCSSANPTVASLTATGTALQWYSASSGGSPLASTTALTTQTYYVSQTVGGCESTRTPVSVTVSTATAPSASSPQTFCSSANPTVASLTATGTGLQWYSASSGGSPLASTTALTTQTYYVSQTVGGCESTRTPVSVTVSTATAPSASSPQTFCSSANPTVASLTATGTGLQWYSASSGGSPLASTTALTTQTYYVSQTVGGCESTRTPVSVTVSTATAPSASSPQTFCSSANPTVASLTATGTALQWYSASSGGSPLASTTALTTQTYYVSQTVGGCESTRTPVSVTVSTATAPSASSPQTFCSSANPTVASLTATGTGLQWYSASSGGSPLASTTALTTQTYYVSQTVGGCESTRTPVSVTVSTATAPSASSPQTFCSSANPTVASLTATGTALQWYSASSGGSPLASTTALTTQTYYVSQTVGGCESTRTPVSVTVSTATAPSASSPQTFCSSANPTVASLTATGTGLQWYSASSGGSPLASTTALTTQTYYVSQTVGGCESTRTPVSVTVSTATAPSASSPQTFCSSANPTVASLTATGTGLQWYSASSGGSPLASTTALTTQTYYVSQTVGGCESTRTPVSVTVSTATAPSASSPQTFCSSANPTVASLTATGTGLQWYSASSGGSPLASTTALTTQTYYVSQTVGGCESTRTPVSVTVSTATAPSASSPQTFCSSANPTVASLTATGTALQWYSASSGGSPLASTTALTTQTYYVSQTVGGCESTRTPVSVTVSTATAPSASSPQTFCSSANPTVASLTATGTGLQWYSASSGGSPLASTTALTTQTYYVSQTVGGCESTRTPVSVTVSTATAPSASSPQTFCSSANPTVASLTATGTALQWYSASSGGSPLASTTALTTQTYYVSQTVGGCESTRTPVSVTVSTATAPSASSPQTFCSSANPTVASLTATGTALQWYSASSGGSPLASTTALTTQTYYVSQTVGGCESTRTPVSVTVSNATPQVSVAASSTSICSGQSVTFTATPTNGGTPSYQWKLNGTNVGTNAPTFTSTTLANADQVSVVMTSSDPCASPGSATSTAITMSASSVTPSVSIVASSTSICSGQSVTFTATPTNGGTPSYQWKLNGTNVGTNAPTFTSTTLANADQVSVVMTSSDPCASPGSATSTAITMSASSVTPSVSIVASSTSICSGQSVTFTATPTNGGTPSYQWKLNGTNVGTNAPTFTSTTLANADQVSVVMTSSDPCALPAAVTSTSITMSASSVTPSVSIVASSTSICSGQSVTFTATPTNGGTPSYQWKLNGANVGTNAPTFISNTLLNGDQVAVVMTSSDPCASPAAVTSTSITMSASSVTPSVSIAASSTSICSGQSVTFTATPTNGGTPSYQWKLNGTNVGTNAPTFTSTTLANADQVSVVMTSSDPCASPGSATSTAITMSASSVTPSVSIVASSTSICSGQSVTFTATPTNGGTPSYQWKLNGTNVGTNAPTFTSTTLANADQVSVVMTSSDPCALPAAVTSTSITMSASSVTPSVSIVASSTSICSGQSVTFTATPTNGGTPSYQWKLNGTNVGTNAPTFTSTTLANADQVSVVMTSSDPCASPAAVTSTAITMNASSVTPSVSIVASSTSICSGQSVTFTATPTNGGTPSYQWKLNGTNVGTNAPTFTSTTLANADQVSVVMTSSDPCASPGSATSTAITMSASSVTPSVSIAASSTSICSGQSVTFTATPTNGGTPSYQWKLNGANVGTNAPTFISNTLLNGDQVAVVMTSSDPCASPAAVTSTSITMSASSVTPSVSIAASSTSICSGQSVTFTATPTNGGTPSYQWKLNGTNVGTNAPTFTSTTLANADQVSVVMTSSDPCASPGSATSTAITMSASSVTPSVSIAASSTSICSGQSVTFTATPTNGGTPSYQWKLNGANVGTNAPTFISNTLLNGDQVAVVMTSSDPCASPAAVTSTSITMSASSVTPSVSIAASSTSICSGQSVTFTATPTNGGTPSYQWKLNGTNVGTNAPTFTSTTLANADQVSVVMTSSDPCASPGSATSTAITMSASSVTPSVSIVASSTSICSGQSVTFTATPTNGGTPSYQWKLNGTNVGTNAPTFTSTTLANADQVSVVMTSSDPCALPAAVTSTSITMSASSVTPSVSIVASSTSICSGQSVTFTATPTNGGGTPSYQWKLNGANVGTNQPTFISNTLVNGDQVSVVMTSSDPCASPATATSTAITMSLNKVEGMQYPFVTAIPNVPLVLQARTIGNNYSYEWFPPDGLNFTTIQNPTYTYGRTMEYRIKITSELGCIIIDTLLVKIDAFTGTKPDVMLPKAWSPNGDGHNDYLFPLTINIKELKYFRIFNRWGQLMFETNQMRKGWNGMVNGNVQAMDVYNWDVEGIGINGERIKRSGSSVLLR